MLPDASRASALEFLVVGEIRRHFLAGGGKENISCA